MFGDWQTVIPIVPSWTVRITMYSICVAARHRPPIVFLVKTADSEYCIPLLLGSDFHWVATLEDEIWFFFTLHAGKHLKTLEKTSESVL